MTALTHDYWLGANRPGESDDNPPSLYITEPGEATGTPSATFPALLDRLLNCWIDYQNAPRNPDQLTELAEARMALDDARAQIAADQGSFSNTAPSAAGPQVAISSAELSKLRIAGISYQR